MTLIESLTMGFSRNVAASKVIASSALLIMGVLISGCSAGSTKSTTASTEPDPPQTYMAPFILGDSMPGYSVSAYTIDDSAQTFSKSTYNLGDVGGGFQQGEQTYYAGTTTTLARGLLSLAGNYSYSNDVITTYSPQQTGNWAVELPSQSGGLAQLLSQPVEPLAPATSCPDSASPNTYQFLTLPVALAKRKPQAFTWNPQTETAFGSVDVSGTGSTITFNNIQQYTLPSTAGANPGTPAVTVTSPMTGACTSGYYGNTTVVPANLTVTNPGPDSNAPPVALVGIGPTGLLVESNAANGEAGAAPFYENLLGAGTGAIGLPKPSSAVSTSDLVGAQYLGFFYEAGSGRNNWSSYVASFGFKSVPQDCQSVATQTATMIYGSDFSNNDPSEAAVQSNGGFPLSCDVAIDLGTQDPKNNGLYPAATVYIGTQYAGNGLGANYSFPAVAIAGQLGGNYAIFLLGADYQGIPNQAWGIYLLQSH